MADDRLVTKRPVHLWAVGIIMTIWNSIGCFDYIMTQTRNPEYLAQFSSAQLAYFNSFPAWIDAAWAFGVWGAIAASILLLFRSRLAFYTYMISLGGLILSSGYHLISDVELETIGGAGGLMFTGLLYIIAIGQLYYSKKMIDKNVLR